MEVKRVTKPVESTYDIKGITETELRDLYKVIGAASTGNLYNVYKTIQLAVEAKVGSQSW